MNDSLNNNEKNVNYLSIVERIKEIEKINSDRQFALLIGMRADSYANAKKRGTFPYEKVIEYCFRKNYSIDEIFNLKNPIKNLKEPSKGWKDRYFNILCIDSEDYIRVPKDTTHNFDDINFFRAFIDEKGNIFLINKTKTKLEDRANFLVKIFDKYYIKNVSIDLDRNFKLLEKEYEPIILKESDFSKIDVIGKVEISYKKL